MPAYHEKNIIVPLSDRHHKRVVGMANYQKRSPGRFIAQIVINYLEGKLVYASKKKLADNNGVTALMADSTHSL